MDARSKFTFRMAREERGVALPVALSILFLVAGLTSIAAKAGIVADHFSFRDRNAKRAVQAASAGIEAAIYQLNLMQPANLRVRDQGRQHRHAAAHARATRTAGASPRPRTSATAPATPSGCPRRDPARQRTGDRAAQDRVHRHGQRHQAAGGWSPRTRERAQPLFAANYAAISLSAVDYGNSVFINGGVGSNGNITLRNNCGGLRCRDSGPRPDPDPRRTARPCAPATRPRRPAPTLCLRRSTRERSDPERQLPHLRGGHLHRQRCLDPQHADPDLTNSGTVTLSGNVYSFC